jgi:acyl-CoA dehydrogenase
MMPTREVIAALDQAFGAAGEAVAEERSATGWSRSLWEELDAQGFGAVLTEVGDADPGAEELWAVAETVGRHGGALPIVEANIARYAMALAAGEGVLTGVPTIVRLPRADRDPGGNGGRARGLVRDVPYGSLGGPVVLFHESSDGDLMGIVDSALCRAAPSASLAGEPRADITLPDSTVAMRPVTPSVGQLLALAQTARILGGARATLSLTVRYSRDRQQFGQPIGRFQAVSQQLAGLGGSVEMLDAMVERLATEVATARGSLAARAAKVCAADTITQAVDVGHQVHGAIGVTAEYGLARHTCLLMAWSDELGSSRDDAVALGRASQPEGALWDLLSSGTVAG